jgi:hypothetical protein
MAMIPDKQHAKLLRRYDQRKSDEGDWSGLDLSPLPYESTCSALWRFAKCNALSFAQMSVVWGPKIQNWGRHRTFTSEIDRLCNSKIPFGWEMPSATELKISNIFGNVLDFFFLRGLRICPLCFEAKYHSFWHQFSLQNLCPIHQCELSSVCQCCGHVLPNYSFSSDFFKNPYYCGHCSQPISGAPLDLQVHIEFREQYLTIAHAFIPLMEWVAQAESSIRLTRCLERTSVQWPYEWHLWCRPHEFFQSVVHALSPLPGSCNAPLYKDLTFLSWRVQMIDSNAPYFPVSNKNYKRESLPNTVYRCVLFRLQKWILNTCGESKLSKKPIKMEYIDDGKAVLSGWLVHELAYMIMRTILESSRHWHIFSEVRTAELMSRGPGVWVETYQARSPRLFWRSIFFALYAAIFHALLRARKVGAINLREFRTNTAGLIAYFHHKNDSNVLAGGVVFPHIDGYLEGAIKMSACYRDNAAVLVPNVQP